MTFDVRIATVEDAVDVAAIYAPLVRETAVSFETEPPEKAEMARRIERTLRTHPFVVVTGSGGVAGYAYATSHRARPAYRFSCEVSVYVAEHARRRGVARSAYGRLFELLRAQGLVNACAGIALPNGASVALHESLGFSPVGVYRSIGHKLGRWHDVGWWELRLAEPADPPREPRPFADLRGV